MAQTSPRLDANFLFRTEEGRIGVKTWRRGTILLAAPLAILTAIWLVLEPYAYRDLSTTAFFAPMTLVAYIYLLFYAFAVLLIAICYYNLSAKRWRDRARPASFAGLLPFFALLSGAMHWLQPRVADVIPFAYVVLVDLALVAIIGWNIVELGFLEERGAPSHPAKDSGPHA
jgi:uncharacterized membrane protein YhaH (DUF805 family)